MPYGGPALLTRAELTLAKSRFPARFQLHQLRKKNAAEIVTQRADTTMPSLVAYYRVSTQGQGRSGLGLEAQRKAVAQFTAGEAMHVEHEFIEVETGKGADALDKRPQLAAALKTAKKLKAPIVVAKLDRLSRDVHFISGLMSAARAVHRHRA